MTEDSRQAVAERLRRRYPRSRVPRPLVIAMAALSMVLAGWWLVTTAWDRAYPPAAAEVTDFRIESDTKINVTFTVDRPNPSVAVTCRVVAQASDLQVVGEQAVPVPPADDRKIDRNVTLITLRRAVLATAQDCSVA